LVRDERYERKLSPADKHERSQLKYFNRLLNENNKAAVLRLVKLRKSDPGRAEWLLARVRKSDKETAGWLDKQLKILKEK
jgi:hypothetical protein